jgi:ubiquinone/menaquinone biosynthesis C-methylase UbiE
MIHWKIFRKVYEKSAEKACEKIKPFIKKREKILDVGCGSGIFAKKLEEKLGVEIFGIDVFDGRICDIPFLIFDGKKIPFPDNFFDSVLLSFVLHHCENDFEILKEAKRVAKKIFIFEDLPEGVFGKTYCFLHWFSWSLLFGNFSKFNFRTKKEWEKIFEDLKLKLISEEDFLIKRKIFVLEKC